MYGEEIKKEYFKMNLKAAEIGFIESMSEIAEMYRDGVGVEKNLDEAIKWYEKAVDKGDSSAAIALGEIYSKNEDIEKEIFYLSKAVDKNDIETIKRLVEIYENRNEFEKVFECCQRGANLGNRHLMEKFADCYFFGRGVQQDDLKALEWYIKVIEIYGWDLLSNNIIRMITNIYNKHFKFRDKKFLKYYLTTEKLGYFNAMFGIAAELYKTDKVRALKWYKMAADAGDYDAAVAVSYIRENDLNDHTYYGDKNSALEWYEKAAQFGNINAAKNLMIIHRDNDNRFFHTFLQEEKTSFYWLKKILEMEGENKNV